MKKILVIVALIALVSDSLIVRSLSLLAPFIRTSLGIDEGRFGYIVSSLVAGTLIATLPIGSKLGNLNARRAFGILLTATGVGLIFVAFQRTYYGLILSLFVVGILRAGLIPLVNRVVTENFSQGQRGSITGIIFASVPLGGFIGATILPALGEVFSWRAGYGLLSILTLGGAVIVWTRLPKELGSSKVTPAPFRWRAILTKSFIVLWITYGLYAFSISAEAFIPLYLVDEVKLSAVVAGVFFGIIQLTGVGGRIMWGLLADRYFRNNRWWLLAFTNGLAGISLFMLMRLADHSPVWLVGLVMVGFGLSAASSWGILSTIIGDVVGLTAVAAGTSAIFWVTNVADISGPILFSNSLRLTHSYQNTLGVFAMITILTTVIFLGMALRQRQLANQSKLNVNLV